MTPTLAILAQAVFMRECCASTLAQPWRNPGATLAQRAELMPEDVFTRFRRLRGVAMTEDLSAPVPCTRCQINPRLKKQLCRELMYTSRVMFAEAYPEGPCGRLDGLSNKRTVSPFFETSTRALCQEVWHVKVGTPNERSIVDRLPLVREVSGGRLDAGTPARRGLLSCSLGGVV